MTTIGICTKCKKQGNIVMHHTKGYEGEYKDFVLPYCYSCHKIIHIEARTSGRCNIPIDEINRLSGNSRSRRLQKKEQKQIIFTETMMTNIRFKEQIDVWPTRIRYSACFRADNGRKMKYI